MIAQERSAPYVFDEFFSSGKEESISPFLTPSSRRLSKNLSLKVALLSALSLLIAFITSFFVPDISYLSLSLVYFLSGTPALIGALNDIKNLDINIDVLMILAALLSVVIGSGMEGGLLLVLFEFSAAMENTVTQKTKSALTSLHHLSPRTAFVVQSDNSILESSIREIKTGARLLVKAGEIIPLDGNVIAGQSFVDLVHLTGESTPAAKKVGDDVPAGGRNLDGTLTIEVTRTSSDSTLARIISLITQAQEAKPRLERLFDHFGKWYAMTIISLSLLFALLFPFILHLPFLGEEGSIYRALAFLIAASPCALIIATPTAYLSAISSCAKRGILLKGGVILDALSKCSIVAFDKTGTITTGELTCTDIALISGSDCTVSQAIAIAAALERHATHPIAKAISAFALSKKIPPIEISDFQSKAGFGLEGTLTLDGKKLSAYIGHSSFILPKLEGITLPEQRSEQMSALLLVGQSLFIFYFTDTLRPNLEGIFPTLQQKYQMRLVMLTGDHYPNAKTVADKTGLTEYYADLRPEDKLDKVIELNQTGHLLMVGDGINDAPALARASVGISMGKIGSATAVEASDVVFLQDDFSLLPWLIGKSHKTLAIVKQNLTLALIVIFFATTPALLGFIPLWLAVILHEGGTVIVGLNSLRLLKKT
jgi:Zn2+/Cd2+-exporting ATPase